MFQSKSLFRSYSFPSLAGLIVLWAVLCFSGLAMAEEEEEVVDEETAQEDDDLIAGPDDVSYRIVDRELFVIEDGDEIYSTDLLCSGAATVFERHLFIACRSRGMFIVSIEDPRYPTPLTLAAMDKELAQVSVLGDQLWVDYADGTGESISPYDRFETLATSKEEEEELGLRGSEGSVDDEFDEADEADESAQADDDEEIVDEDDDGLELAVDEESSEEEEEVDKAIGIEGAIVEIRGGVAVINLGRADGLSEDHRVELYSIETVRIGGEEIREEKSSGVGQVQALGENHAEVTLPINVRVEEDMLARVTEQGATTQPQPRLENVLTIDTAVRPFLPMDALGLGVLGEFGLGYHFSGPWVFEVRLDPVGLTATGSSTDDLRTFAANAILSFSGENFQVGLGTGLSRVHWGVGDRTLEEEPVSVDNIGVGAVQYVRLGQMEDVYVSLTTNFVVVDRGWQFGGATLQGEAPARAIGDNMWYLGRIGGGVPGHFLFEVGLRQLVSGNGGPGSVFVTPTVGYGSIARDVYEIEEDWEGNEHWVREDLGYSGPMIGFGVEWRQ